MGYNLGIAASEYLGMFARYKRNSKIDEKYGAK